MRSFRLIRLYQELWAASGRPISKRDLRRLLKLSPTQMDEDVRFLYREGLVTLSGPPDERERVKARTFPKLEELQEKYRTRWKREREGEGEDERFLEELLGIGSEVF